MRTMASSLSGQKRNQPEVEAEVVSSCCCAVCFEVLLDPVTLPCAQTARSSNGKVRRLPPASRGTDEACHPRSAP